MDDLFLRRALVLASALVYWVGVCLQARRVRHRIGRSPNLRPRGLRERLLWAGWAVVVAGWLAQPFLVEVGAALAPLRLAPPLLNPAGLVLGTLLLVLGYAGTSWCYTAMGETWRIGINRKEKTALVRAGPYSRVRHPIYLFQVVMLGGVCLLLPTVLALLLALLHLVCVVIKAKDEEAFLLGVHGEAYQTYVSQTGRLLPRL